VRWAIIFLSDHEYINKVIYNGLSYKIASGL